MVASSVAGISPYYRGRNGSLPSIGRKGRFLCGNAENKWIESKDRIERQEMAVSPAVNKVRALLQEPVNNY